MIKLVRTDSNNTDFVFLVELLNDYLKIVDGADHEFYNQYNNIDVLKHVIVAYIDNKPVGCGAFKKYTEKETEIKRMFTRPETRSQGVASKILKALEAWSEELGFEACLLETGKRQVEAVQFYKKNAYIAIPNYGQYKGVTNSVCFKKSIT
ncbi:GNAT family N-acetyltransferase [Flavivirga abyssicola]|uniref:GNAT family N-acetyltransferase n=1 Tax=Flavivirga abyssicola TaxID=3063533 RepID=UPI0026DFE31C|nr:GNAT family N-acetyltransferase [Flavivirga sp. MEBiC07777]WVK12358.1 GNAT family N-acetyltransferase [Flavivirga sp. MEBiC07777]